MPSITVSVIINDDLNSSEPVSEVIIDFGITLFATDDSNNKIVPFELFTRNNRETYRAIINVGYDEMPLSLYITNFQNDLCATYIPIELSLIDPAYFNKYKFQTYTEFDIFVLKNNKMNNSMEYVLHSRVQGSNTHTL